ncbi:sulfatase-like hydrolase/transferase [bacterium]|nr:sulfatase-like hydrolase/transferase [bacterium]
MNVILIALDTLRADHLGIYGYKKPTSPFIDKFGKNAVVFENFFAPSIPTQPSYTTFFTGQFSLTHRIITHGGKEKINPESPWLPEILLKNDYLTCAVDNLAVMKNWFLRGYEFYINPSITIKYFQTVKAEDVTKRTIEWLEKYYKEKFLIFIHYWDPHTPYIPPENLIKLFYPENKNPFDKKDKRMDEFYKTPHGKSWSKTWLRKNGKLIRDPEYIESLYDAEIRYMDTHLGKLFSFFEKKNLFENSLIIIFSDHGEIMYHHPGFFDHHGLYDENIHCPLLIHLPGVKPKRIKYLVQHCDIAPTILEILKLSVPEKMEGKSLYKYITGENNKPLYSALYTQECTYQVKWAIRTERYKLIVSRRKYDIHRLPPIELYDLKKDPYEQKNIYGENKKIAEKLRNQLEKWIEKMLKKNKMKEDPLKKTIPPLGKNWKKFVSKFGYW